MVGIGNEWHLCSYPDPLLGGQFCPRGNAEQNRSWGGVSGKTRPPTR